VIQVAGALRPNAGILKSLARSLAGLQTYVGLAEKITGQPLPVSPDPRGEIIQVMMRAR